MSEYIHITEKTHPIRKIWIVKNTIMWPPLIALLFSIAGKHFHPYVFIVLLIIGFPFFYYYLTLEIKNYHYDFKEQLLTLRQGFIAKSERHVIYGRIQNIVISQSLINRLLGLGSVTIETASEGAGIRLSGYTEGIVLLVPFGFLGNRVVIPGLSYQHAVEIKEVVMQLIKMNPIDDAQSGL